MIRFLRHIEHGERTTVTHLVADDRSEDGAPSLPRGGRVRPMFQVYANDSLHVGLSTEDVVLCQVVHIFRALAICDRRSPE